MGKKKKKHEDDVTSPRLREFEGCPLDQTNSPRHSVWELENFIGKDTDWKKRKIPKSFVNIPVSEQKMRYGIKPSL